MDVARYRAVFVEEATEHLAEISRACLELEKEPARSEAIDEIFRMAHSIKGMAASLGYDAIAEVAHRLEDRMQEIRSAGRLRGPEEMARLFQGLEALEAMVAAVRETGAPPAAPREAARSAPLDAPAPPPTVRVNTRTLDRFLSTVGEVILTSSQLRTASTAAAPGESSRFAAGLDRMDRVVGELQRRVLELRTTPLLRIVEPLPRMAREIALRRGKRVEVEIRRAEVELDRSILDRLSDPLVHLVRNAVDHGIETPEVRAAAGKDPTGHISIDARRERDTVRIEVRDDGAGIDLDAVRRRAVEAGLVFADLAADLPPEEVAAFIFHPGLSTASAVSDVSGRGVGMDAVRTTIESLGGRVGVETRPGRGTAVHLEVPVTAAVQRVLLLDVEGETVAIPIARVERILQVAASQIERSGREAFVKVGDEPVPVLRLAEQMTLAPERRAAAGAAGGAAGRRSGGDSATDVTLVLTDVRGERVALRVEKIAGQQQIYVKPVPELLSGVKALAGLTILGDGRPVFLLDLNQLA